LALLPDSAAAVAEGAHGAPSAERLGNLPPAKRVGCIALFDILFAHMAFANHGR